MVILVSLFHYLLTFFTFLSECTQYSDCPNSGQNYECVDYLCNCVPGHALDGDDCVGRLTSLYLFLYHLRGLIFATLGHLIKYEQLLPTAVTRKVHTPRREERRFFYFNHLSKEFLEQMIPHLKALI